MRRSQKNFPSKREIRAVSLKTKAGLYYQIMCHRRRKKLKVHAYADESRYRPDSGEYFTVCFCYGHIPYRKLCQYIEAGIWLQDNLQPQQPCVEGEA